MKSIFPNESKYNLIEDILELTKEEEGNLFFYGRAQGGLHSIHLYSVNNEIHNLSNEYIFQKKNKQFEAYWNRVLSYFERLKKDRKHSWHVVLVNLNKNYKIRVQLIYREVDRNFFTEDLIKWEYLTLGLTEEVKMLEPEDQEELLKHPPGNPFQNHL